VLPNWMPDLESLDLLLSVADLGSMGRAAEAHRISQPGASTRLRHLERRLGVTLLIRTSRGSVLTRAGEEVVARARDVITAANALTKGVLMLRDDRAGTLRVAASFTIAEYLLPAWLLAMRQTMPNADVIVCVANSVEVAERVLAGRADLGLIESPTVPADLGVHRLGSDRLALVVSPSHPLAANAEQLRPIDLMDHPLLLREPGSGTRDTFLAALGAALGRGTRPDLPKASELGSTTTILAVARAGGGVGVVSERAAASELASGALIELSVRDMELTRDLHAVWAGSAPSELAREFIRLAAHSIANYESV
jgi:DNA-binding transcriptional LysR family regulator